MPQDCSFFFFIVNILKSFKEISSTSMPSNHSSYFVYKLNFSLFVILFSNLFVNFNGLTIPSIKKADDKSIACMQEAIQFF